MFSEKSFDPWCRGGLHAGKSNHLYPCPLKRSRIKMERDLYSSLVRKKKKTRSNRVKRSLGIDSKRFVERGFVDPFVFKNWTSVAFFRFNHLADSIPTKFPDLGLFFLLKFLKKGKHSAVLPSLRWPRNFAIPDGIGVRFRRVVASKEQFDNSRDLLREPNVQSVNSGPRNAAILLINDNDVRRSGQAPWKFSCEQVFQFLRGCRNSYGT